MTGDQVFYLAITGIVAVSSVAVVPIVGYFWSLTRSAEQNAVLKKAMIDRGMTADDIVRVLEAGTPAVWESGNATAIVDRMIRQKYPAEEIVRVLRQGRPAPAAKPDSAYAA
jgi:hypothetical protein